jgi:hypothetical protein
VFKELANLGAVWKQAQELGTRMQGLGDELRGKRVCGSAGGGMVELEANGLMEVLRCKIDPALLAQQDRELLEDLVASAVNQAVGKAKQLHAEAVRTVAGGLPLPGLEQTLSKLFAPPTGNPPSAS